MKKYICILASAALLGACGEKTETVTPAASPNASPNASDTTTTTTTSTASPADTTTSPTP